MDRQGSFSYHGENSSASQDEMKTSLLHHLDYDSSDSETHSSVPSPPSGGPLNDIVKHSSLPPDIEMDAFSILSTMVPGTSSQGDIPDNSSEWIPNVNFVLPSFPDSIPQLKPNSIQPTFSVDPFQNTTSYHLDNVSNIQNQPNFAIDATLPTPSFLPSMIDTGHHDQFRSSFYPTSDVSSLEARPLSFTNDVFPASDLYADLVNAHSDYGYSASDAETWFQPHLYGSRTMDLDSAQQPAPFDEPERISTQNDFVQPMSNVDTEASFFANTEQLENPMTMLSTPGQADALKIQTKDSGNTNPDAQTEHQYQIPELLKALEASRKEVETLKNKLYSVSKKYKNLKISCDELREFRRTHRTTAEQHDSNEIKEYKEQIEASILDRKEQSRTIDKLIVKLRNLEEENARDEERIKLGEERIKRGEERIKEDEERIQRDGERLKRDKEKFRRDEESRRVLLKEAIDDHKKKMSANFKKQQNDIKAVLDRINARYKNIIPASNNHNDPKTFRSSTHVNTTREAVITCHQQRFSNGNFPN